MDKIENLNLTNKQKDKLKQILESSQEKRIQKFVARKQHKRQNNINTYETRKELTIKCECCNVTFDKYYEKTHNKTTKHKVNMEKRLCKDIV